MDIVDADIPGITCQNTGREAGCFHGERKSFGYSSASRLFRWSEGKVLVNIRVDFFDDFIHSLKKEKFCLC
jgi:hypothetical protein